MPTPTYSLSEDRQTICGPDGVVGYIGRTVEAEFVVNELNFLAAEIVGLKETIKDLKADLGDAQKPKENWGDSEEERAWRRDAGGRG